jgi:hypothetical protein
MARKHEYHPHVGSGRVGLAVGELQILHDGHRNLYSYMASTCDTAIAALGSCEKFGVFGHPFQFEQRKAMLEGACGPMFKFVQLQDIDSTLDNESWMAYVLDRITRSGLPEPTDYFTGSEVDARWYEHFFASTRGKPVRDAGGIRVYERLDRETNTVRRLHVVDRVQIGLPSGRDVRFLVEWREPEWRNYVPARLWDFIEMNYPPHLRQPVKVHKLLEVAEGQYPVGTRLVEGRNPDKVLVLRDDGKWRELRDEPDEKAEAALRMHAARANGGKGTKA